MTGVSHLDLLIIGGGINGAGIARDAAGRGLKVALCEKHDLASATSSASSKLIHGGLRYLEHCEFRLVRESLAEREVLLAIAPHLVRPLQFVLPQLPGLRPGWMLRAGLFLYDHLAGRRRLGASRSVALAGAQLGKGLKPEIGRGFSYWDCWGEDARLVVANALDAARRGAAILTRTECVAAEPSDGGWKATLRGSDGTRRVVGARAIVNAAGPWVGCVLSDVAHVPSRYRVRLVKGSHIVLPRLYPGGHAFILQNTDGRVVFMIPLDGQFTLVGTTEVPLEGDAAGARVTRSEVEYLCDAVNRALARPVSPADAVHRFCGVRPLFDDGTTDPSKVTRDYVLELSAGRGAPPVLSVFGGKLTTYRRLAEQVLEKLGRFLPVTGGSWTASAPLPGGDLPAGGIEGLAKMLAERHAVLPRKWLESIAERHGSEAERVIGGAREAGDLGAHFGAGLYAREVDYLMDVEWAVSAEDVLWRRTRMGLHLGPEQTAALESYMKETLREAGCQEPVGLEADLLRRRDSGP